MTRVGFVITANKASWLGGLNYLRTLMTAVTDLGSGEIQPVIFLGHRFDPAASAVLPDVEIHETGLLDPWRPGWIARVAAIVGTRNDPTVARLLRRHGIDVVSHSGPMGRRAGPPAVSWIADFQHRRLPEFFSARELASRDREFRRSCDQAARVIVSSQAALADLRDFRPSAAPKARVLHFVPDPPPAAAADRAALLDRHGIREPFVYVPNQLWAHKNHRVAVEALGLLAAAGVDVTVVATGDTEDYRNRDVVEPLRRRIAELGIEDRFLLLGRVAYEEVAGLMRACTAVLNPSLFEGWSTTVEEAKSLGKRAVLSDIPVHREQDPPGGRFFPPHDPEVLAAALEATLADADPERDRRLEEEAAAALPGRRRAFALAYEAIVREALADG